MPKTGSGAATRMRRAAQSVLAPAHRARAGAALAGRGAHHVHVGQLHLAQLLHQVAEDGVLVRVLGRHDCAREDLSASRCWQVLPGPGRQSQLLRPLTRLNTAVQLNIVAPAGAGWAKPHRAPAPPHAALLGSVIAPEASDSP